MGNPGHKTPTNTPVATGVAALNVYKKVALIRSSEDVLRYEDESGQVKEISDLHLAAVETVSLSPLCYVFRPRLCVLLRYDILIFPSFWFYLQTPAATKPKPKDDIPVPKIVNVESYNKDLPPTFCPPKSFVRYHKPTQKELKENLEYVIDAEDEVWLHNNTRFGGSCGANKAAAAANAKPSAEDVNAPKGTVQLPLSMFERMLDILEKATGFDTIITQEQAEGLFVKHLPQLYRMYPVKARGGVTTLKHVVADVYSYWVSKRSKLKRPLLRRFWPVTSTDDTNPHLVFRPREKEKYKLRRKRQNDMDGLRKLQQLKHDFSHVRALLELVQRREELNKSLILMQVEWFHQKIYDAVDTSGLVRLSSTVRRDHMNEQLATPKYFDSQNSWAKSKKARHSSQSGQSFGGVTSSFEATLGGSQARGGGDGSSGGGRPMIIAGKNHGEPAPNFLHPLATRETYTSSWDRAVPHVTTYENSHPVPTFRFRHRPRIGRGGRLCIDRVPQPIDPNFPPNTVFTAGASMKRAREPKDRLLDLLPRPLDRDRVRRSIEAICIDSLKDEYSPPAGLSTAEQEEHDGDAVIVKTDDWLSTDDQVWGEERYALGPL